MKIKNYNISSFYLTMCSTILLCIGNMIYKEDDVSFSFISYGLSLISAFCAIVFSIIGIGQKKSSYKYLSAAIYIYIIILVIYIFNLLNEPVVKG